MRREKAGVQVGDRVRIIQHDLTRLKCKTGTITERDGSRLRVRLNSPIRTGEGVISLPICTIDQVMKI